MLTTLVKDNIQELFVELDRLEIELEQTHCKQVARKEDSTETVKRLLILNRLRGSLLAFVEKFSWLIFSIYVFVIHK